jgi:ribonuclease-3
LQGSGFALPVYQMEKVSGQAHKQRFEVSCSVDELKLRSQGSGTTRRDAEQEAAANLLIQTEKAQ